MPAVETLEIFTEISQTGTWMFFYELQEDGLYEYCIHTCKQREQDAPTWTSRQRPDYREVVGIATMPRRKRVPESEHIFH